MKRPLLQEISYKTGEALLVQKFKEKNFDVYWHFHPELEITHIAKGSGKRYVGDKIDEYKAGDLIMVGSSLPHCWISSPENFNNNKLYMEAHVIQFRGALIVDERIDLPDFYYVRQALSKSKQGLKIEGKTKNEVIKKIQLMYKAKGIKRYILLLEILDLIGRDRTTQTLSGKAYSVSFLEHDDDKVRQIYNYVSHHFQEQIKIEQLAILVNMNTSSLSRYFKNKTKTNIVTFINEFRISNVCKLLINNQYTIQQAAYKCGYNNIANFNRQFKKAMNLSPIEYVKKYRAVME